MGNKTVYDYPYYTFDADEATINRIKKNNRFNGGKKKGNIEFYVKSDEGLEVSIYRKNKDTQLTSVRFHGDGCAEVGASYRRMTLENNARQVENLVNKNNEQGRQEVKYNELNFKYNAVGSDETGKSETFKEIIVVAAYIKPGKEHMDALLKLNINDSKTIAERSTKRLDEIGEELSNIGEKSPTIKSYSEFKEKLGEEGGTLLIETDHLIFCVTAKSNKEYNDSREDVNTQLAKLHGKVLRKLFEYINGDGKPYIVVDDFFSEDKNRKDGNRMKLVKELNDSGCSQIFSFTKADENVIAVSCASVISAYLQDLHRKELAEEYGLACEDIFEGTISRVIYDVVRNGNFYPKEGDNSKKVVYDFMVKLKEKGDNVLTEFFDKYAKKHT